MMTIYSIFPDDIYHGKTLDFVILEIISKLQWNNDGYTHPG